MYQSEQCTDEPYWGIVFVWWACAAFLIGAATTTGMSVALDIFKEAWLLSTSKSDSRPAQVQDVGGQEAAAPVDHQRPKTS